MCNWVQDSFAASSGRFRVVCVSGGEWFRAGRKYQLAFHRGYSSGSRGVFGRADADVEGKGMVRLVGRSMYVPYFAVCSRGSLKQVMVSTYSTHWRTSPPRTHPEDYDTDVRLGRVDSGIWEPPGVSGRGPCMPGVAGKERCKVSLVVRYLSIRGAAARWMGSSGMVWCT